MNQTPKFPLFESDVSNNIIAKTKPATPSEISTTANNIKPATTPSSPKVDSSIIAKTSLEIGCVAMIGFGHEGSLTHFPTRKQTAKMELHG